MPNEFVEVEPLVTVSPDDMEAYLYLPRPQDGASYTMEELLGALEMQGVVRGIQEEKIQKMIQNKQYMVRVLVAQGKEPTEGTDGYFEYMFNQELDKKPKIKEDGSVDYWDLNLVEPVSEGQVIAVYHAAVQGEDGYTVTGLDKITTKARELQPLKGKGFSRSEDNLVYTSLMTGKIEMVNEHINISPVYEIFGNVGIESGNIDFRGDVLVHGNVESGMKIKATGTVTVDGVVEAAQIEAGHDIVLRGGVMGANKAMIRAKGSVHAKFFEYTTVSAEEDIDAEVFVSSKVSCDGLIVLNGRKGRIIGGNVHAVKGVECREIGNDTEIQTRVDVGVEMNAFRRRQFLVQENEKNSKELKKIVEGMDKIDKLVQAGHQIDPGKKMLLFRAKIKLEADLTRNRVEIEQLDIRIENGSKASVKVFHIVHPGTMIGIGNLQVAVKETFKTIEFVKRTDKIIMQDLS